MDRPASTPRGAPSDKIAYRNCTAMLRSLVPDRRSTLPDLLRRMEHLRGRPIHLVPFVTPADGPCGMWIGTDTADFVFYPSTASAVTVTVIVGHEVGHMLFDEPTQASPTELAALLLPTVDPGTISAVAGRTGYEDAAERRAEIFGTLFAERQLWTGSPVPAADPAVLAEISASLERARRHG